MTPFRKYSIKLDAVLDLAGAKRRAINDRDVSATLVAFHNAYAAEDGEQMAYGNRLYRRLTKAQQRDVDLILDTEV